ncbi:hypothetical protein ACJMK2_018266 [Sinanodonta woodiana]|uniref:NADP-dependent oxidoreductase domain-containing protein n=1 Tax=Sinanodonta woodiana TaxID=1069815 RepID=A0ABD3UEY8_SINWO
MATCEKVEYRFLGRSGLKVSNICLGTMTFGGSDDDVAVYQCPTRSDEDKAHTILNRYRELGGNFIDTANKYSYGKSESIIGSWLEKQKRDQVVVASKVRFPMDKSNVNAVGLSRRHMIESCEASLSRLRTNYIDLLQAHIWDNGVPLEETLRTFDDLIRCGKIRYFGVSNFCGWQMQKVAELTKLMGLNPVVSLQQQYSLLCRQSEWEEFMVCRNEGIAVLPWSPLKGGLLSGKYKRDETPDPLTTRIGFIHTDEKKALSVAPAWSKYRDNEEFWKLMDVIGKIAANHGKTIAQVAIRWLLQQDVVCSVVMGATSVQQIEDNMEASAGWQITEEEMKQLDAASPRVTYYPYEMIWNLNGPDRFNPFNNSVKI